MNERAVVVRPERSASPGRHDRAGGSHRLAAWLRDPAAWLRDPAAWLRDPTARRRLGLGLVAFTLAVALIVTLYPFDFRLATASWARIDWRLYYPGHNDRDLLLNLLMLVPLGAGLALARAGRARFSQILLEAGAVGFGTALIIETLQIFERARFPQAADVCRNGIDCLAGALTTTLILRAIDRPSRR